MPLRNGRFTPKQPGLIHSQCPNQPPPADFPGSIGRLRKRKETDNMPQTRKLSVERRLVALEQRVTMLELAPPPPFNEPAPDETAKPYHLLLRSDHFAVEVDHQHQVTLIAPNKDRFTVMSAIPPTETNVSLAIWILENQPRQKKETLSDAG